MKRLSMPFFSVLIGLATTCTPALASDFYVSPQGSDRNGGTSSDTPKQTIQSAIDQAQPGDTINLADGTYLQDFVTKVSGTENQPITITGSKDAVIKGGGGSRIIQINHSNISIKGFTVDGLHADPNSVEGYRSKLIYVEGKDKAGIENVKILHMDIKNGGGECIRLRRSVKNSEIGYSSIKNCGIYDFVFNEMVNKNGEGVYIGTAPEQNEYDVPDDTSFNWVHSNYINTQANECVDVKEGGKNNTIENNFCTRQKDPNSAGISIRGNNNTIRFNVVEKTIGSAIRLGGDTPNDGVNNNVYGNSFKDTTGGGIKFQAEKQGIICENSINDQQEKVAIGNFGSLFSPSDICTSTEK